MREENLPHKLLKSYLTRLVMLNLVEQEELGHRKFVRTTQRGVAALRNYQDAVALINGRTAVCYSKKDLPMRSRPRLNEIVSIEAQHTE